jgi:hypothetical protein
MNLWRIRHGDKLEVEMKKIIICIFTLIFSGFLSAKGAFVEIGDPSFFPDKITDILSFKSDSAGNLYVAYVEETFYLSVAKFDGKSWSDTGIRKFTGRIANYAELYDATEEIFVSFTLDKSGVPYVAYSTKETISTSKFYLNVMKYSVENDKWEKVGSPVTTRNLAKWISIDVNSKGIQHVAFSACLSESCEKTNEDNLNYTIDTTSVMKFENGEWKYVGEQMFMYDPENYVESQDNAVLIDTSDVPYVSFSAGGNFFLTKFSEGAWSVEAEFESVSVRKDPLVRGDGFYFTMDGDLVKFDGKEFVPPKEFETSFSSMAIDSSDIIYISFYEYIDQDRMVGVKKLVSDKWETVGNEELFAYCFSALITVDSSDIPNVIYISPEGLVLMKYDPEFVEEKDEGSTDEDAVDTESSDKDQSTEDKSDSDSSACSVLVI